MFYLMINIQPDLLVTKVPLLPQPNHRSLDVNTLVSGVKQCRYTACNASFTQINMASENNPGYDHFCRLDVQRETIL